MKPFDRPATSTDDDPALEADLHQLRLTGRPLPPTFTAAVLADLSPYPSPTKRGELDGGSIGSPSLRRGGGRGVRSAWWQGQVAACVLGLLGLAIMLGTADLTGVLTGWWSAADTWLTGFATDGGNALDLLWSAVSTGSAAPQASLGLIVGALILALGAGGFLLRSLDWQTA
ncbi:MAG: hypothetical protein M3Z04_04025 [Chloroflexota bacterium]|nr:hypothetical protein [Chloroflexota bacterium]